MCSVTDHIFRQLTSPTLRSVHLDFLSTPPVNQRDDCDSRVQSLIRQICGRNAAELKVDFYGYDDGSAMPLPTCVFETQSLIVLELIGPFRCKLPDNGIVSLPNLKKLRMIGCDMDYDLMGLLFKSCPLLEDLHLSSLLFSNDGHFVDISAQYLKRLTIRKVGSKHLRFVIDAPDLEEVKIVTSCRSSYCFVKDLSRLHKALIYVNGDVGDYCSQMLVLVQAFSRVRSLCLRDYISDSLYYLRDRVMPIFHNLTLFKMTLFGPCGWKDLLLFLRCTPNLQVLVLWHDDECSAKEMDWSVLDSVPVCLSTKLKRMEIDTLLECKKGLEFIGYILSNACVLEQLDVRVSTLDACTLCKEFKFCNGLFNYPRSSLACEIEFSGEYLSASSKGFKNGSLDCRIHGSVPVCD